MYLLIMTALGKPSADITEIWLKAYTEHSGDNQFSAVTKTQAQNNYQMCLQQVNCTAAEIQVPACYSI